MTTPNVFSRVCLFALILAAPLAHAKGQSNEVAFEDQGSGKEPAGKGVVTGRVTTGGVPIKHVEVSIQAGAKKRYVRSTTGTDGRYRFIKVPDGPFEIRAYWLEESGIPGGRSQTQSGQLKEKGKTVVDFDFDEGSSGIEGKVRVDGKPAPTSAAMALTLSTGRVEAQVFRVEPDGSFSLTNLPPSKAQISFTCRSGDGEARRCKNVICDLLSGQTVKLDVRFQEGISVSGKLKGIEPNKYYAVYALAGEWKAEDCDRDVNTMFQRMARVAGSCPVGTGVETYEVKHLDPGPITLIVYYAGDATKIKTTKPIALRVLQVGKEPLTDVDFDLPPP